VGSEAELKLPEFKTSPSPASGHLGFNLLAIGLAVCVLGGVFGS